MALRDSDSTEESGEIDVDSVLERIEGESDRGGGIPMDKQADPPAPTPPPASEIEFDWNGKQIKAPFSDPRVKQWASQGYDYGQKMSAFNQERTQFETERGSHKELVDRYKQVDDYVKQNPQWWDHVNTTYQQAMGQMQRAEAQQGHDLPADHPLVQKVAGLEGQLSELSQFKTSFENRESLQMREQEDKVLTGEIQSIREQHKNLDWTSPDQNGRDLESRVIQHALENKIASFKVAFKDIMHDELLKRAEERGKESIAKDRQKQTKLGLLGTSPTPRRGVSEVSDVKSKTYNDIEREIREEYGIA